MNKPIDKVLETLEGLNTVETVQKKLRITRKTAIKRLYELRKLGFVETSGGGKQPRLYRVSRNKVIKIGNPGLYDIVNENSPIKVAKPYEHRVMGKKLTVEEAIIRAIQSRNFRLILASLALFNKVKNWPRLYSNAKKENVRRKVGALYDAARTTIKVRRMDNRTRKLLLKARGEDGYIIKRVRSKDFKYIENTWQVFIPFNKKDLARLKE